MMPRPIVRLWCSALAAVFFASACAPALAGTHENNGFANTADSIINLLTTPATAAPAHRDAPQHRTTPKSRPRVAAKPQPRPQIAVKAPQPRARIAVKPQPQLQPRPQLAAKPLPRPQVASKPQARPRFAFKPLPHRQVAVKTVPRLRLARTTAAHAVVASKAPSRLQVALQQFATAPHPRRAPQQIARLQSLPAMLAKINTAPGSVPKLSANVLPQPKVKARSKPLAAMKPASKANASKSKNAEPVIVAVAVKPAAEARVVALTVGPKPDVKPRAKQRKIKRVRFKPSRGGHGIAIVRPWQGSIPDTYCDLPTGCAAATAAPVAASASGVVAPPDPTK